MQIFYRKNALCGGNYGNRAEDVRGYQCRRRHQTHIVSSAETGRKNGDERHFVGDVSGVFEDVLGMLLFLFTGGF